MQSISLFKRALKLNVGGVEIDQTEGTNRGLRVTFSVERDDKKHPNNATIQVYNLSGASREKLEDNPEVTCSLEAGYVDGYEQIFYGVVRTALSDHDGTDWITTVASGDGEKAFKEATIHKTFAIGTPIAAVIAEFARSLGVGPGNSAFAGASIFEETSAPALKQALTISGRVSDELSAFMTSIGGSWSIQNGELTVHGSFVPPTVGPIIAKETGLVDRVTIDEKGLVSFKALLQPALVPGAVFTLKSNRATGLYEAIKTHHYGDTYGDDWFVECQAKPL